jgi:DNA-binding response OmpR family regulator
MAIELKINVRIIERNFIRFLELGCTDNADSRINDATYLINADVLRFADLSLNRCTREVFRGNRAISLTVKEFDLLKYLLSRPGQVFTRSQILENVWGYDFEGCSNIIEVYVGYLRKNWKNRVRND